jgi:hypothetical protein
MSTIHDDNGQYQKALKMYDFRRELATLLNRYSFDNEVNTPDYILAEYVFQSILNYKEAIASRDFHRYANKASMMVYPLEEQIVKLAEENNRLMDELNTLRKNGV